MPHDSGTRAWRGRSGSTRRIRHVMSIYAVTICLLLGLPWALVGVNIVGSAVAGVRDWLAARGTNAAGQRPATWMRSGSREFYGARASSTTRRGEVRATERRHPDRPPRGDRSNVWPMRGDRFREARVATIEVGQRERGHPRYGPAPSLVEHLRVAPAPVSASRRRAGRRRFCRPHRGRGALPPPRPWEYCALGPTPRRSPGGTPM
jgi:hypothetical protein